MEFNNGIRFFGQIVDQDSQAWPAIDRELKCTSAFVFIASMKLT